MAANTEVALMLIAARNEFLNEGDITLVRSILNVVRETGRDNSEAAARTGILAVVALADTLEKFYSTDGEHPLTLFQNFNNENGKYDTLSLISDTLARADLHYFSSITIEGARDWLKEARTAGCTFDFRV